MSNYDITEWISRQDIWIKEAAMRLYENKELDNNDIDDFIDIIEGKTKVNPNLCKLKPNNSSLNDISIVSIGNIKGIDRLNPRKPLNFSENGLNVIYGRNGSGKSGYARILKSACGKTTEALKFNVYDSPPNKQTVDFGIICDGKRINKTWDAKSNFISLFSSVDIFDGIVGEFYLRKDSEASYIPPELTLFSDLALICDRVASEIENRKKALISKLPVFPIEYSRTQVALVYTRLECAKEKEIEDLLNFSDDKLSKMEELEERLKITNLTEAANKSYGIAKRINAISVLIKRLFEYLNSDFYNEMEALIEEAKKRRADVEKGAIILKSSSKLDGVGNSVWMSLWEAAREYSETIAYKGVSFPNIEDGAFCVLCNQELNDDAKCRMSQFEKFVQDSLVKKAKEAESKLEGALNELPDIQECKQCKENLVAAVATEIKKDLYDEILDFVDSAFSIIKKYKNKSIVISDIPKLNIDTMIQKLLEIENEYKAKAKQFEHDAKTFDYEKAKKELLELRARKWIFEQRKALDEEKERIKKIKLYEKLKKKTNTRSITIEAGRASEMLVTKAYINRFNYELNKLGASKLSVELVSLKNVKGKGKYRIQLKNVNTGYETSVDILSDGEKRIVSLAAFLANSTAEEKKVPFVFDDPISSLDQEFEEATARRLYDLSATRQVIIFTHRLSFLGIISDVSKGKEISTICINDEIWGTGEPSDIPINAKNPKKAFNKLLNEDLAQAEKKLANDGKPAYEIYAQSICSNFRKLIERTIEIILLNGIIERHRPSVQTQNRIEKLSTISKKDCVFLDELMSKYSKFEHSQSNEFPIPLPAPDILKKI